MTPYLRALPLGMILLGALAAPGCGAGDSGLASAGTTGGKTTGGSGGGGSSSTGSGAASTSSGAASTSSGSGSGSGSGGGTSSGSTSSGASSGSTSSGASSGSTSSGGGGVVADPNVDGPYPYTEIDDSITVPASGNTVPIHCAYPTGGPSAGPYPVVVVGHGFQLPASQYYGYVKRLASFGYVALTADFPAGFVGVSNTKNAKDMLGAIDWAASKPALAGKADTSNVGATGHSMGGKVALLAATMDARIKAAIELDPVNSSVSCSAADCPDVAKLMPTLKIPTGFVGETTDASGGFQPCAPAADNYTTFYAGANTPSLEVTVTGANHMSFLDDVATCGLVCGFCNMATASNASVNSLAKAYVTAFYERHLRGNAGYDTYLTGADAQARYVATKQATITSK